MKQGKLNLVKQEIARLNINILGISKLKWTGMGEFKSDDHYIYYCEQESFRINWIDPIINKRIQNAVLRCNLKDNNDLSSFPRQTIKHHSNPSLYPNHWCQKNWNWQVLCSTMSSRTKTNNNKKMSFFIIGDWNAKVGSQEISRITGKFGIRVQNEAGQKLTEFCQKNMLVIANTLFQ